MREERGYMSLNEVKLGVHLPTAFTTMGIEKMGHRDFCEASVIGKKYTGKEAERIRLADKVFKEAEIEDQTIAFAKSIAEASTCESHIMHLFKEDIWK